MVIKKWLIGIYLKLLLKKKALIYAHTQDFVDPSLENNQFWSLCKEDTNNHIVQCGKSKYFGNFSFSEGCNLTRILRYNQNPNITILQTSIIFEFKFIDDYENKQITIFSNGQNITSLAPHSSADGLYNDCLGSVDEHNHTINILEFNPKDIDKIELSEENKPGLWAFSMLVKHVICPENSFYNNKDAEGFNCQCKSGYYRDQNSSLIRCLPCAVYCVSCSGPEENQCLECIPGFSFEYSVCRNNTGKCIFLL